MDLEKIKDWIDDKWCDFQGFIKWWKVRDIWYNTKGWFHRAFRGYSDYDIFELGVATATLIRDRLKVFKEEVHGFPSMLEVDGADPDGSKGMEKWSSIIQDMIDGWDFYARYDDIESELMDKHFYNKGYKFVHGICGFDKEDPATHEAFRNAIKQTEIDLSELQKVADEKLQLYIKYMRCLWD